MSYILKIALLFVCLLVSTATGQVREYKDLQEEGNDGFATWSYVNQFGNTTDPDSACFYIYDELTQTLQYSSCNSDPDDIQQFLFTPCGLQILDSNNLYEAKIFSTIWTYPEGSPAFTGQRSYRVWVANSRAIEVTGSFPGTCTVTPE